MTKLREMVPGLRYKVVTKGKYFKVAEVLIMADDKVLDNVTTGEFTYDWERCRNKVEIDLEYYQQLEMETVTKLKELRDFIKKVRVEQSFTRARAMIESWPQWQKDVAREFGNAVNRDEEELG